MSFESLGSSFFLCYRCMIWFHWDLNFFSVARCFASPGESLLESIQYGVELSMLVSDPLYASALMLTSFILMVHVLLCLVFSITCTCVLK